MRGTTKTDIATLLLIGVAIGITITGIAYLLVVPTWADQIPPLVDKGWFEIVGGSITLLGGLWGIWLLYRRTRANEDQAQAALKNEISTRFQKGVELIANSHRATRIGGIFIVRDVAIEQPKLYARPAIDLLTTLATEQSADEIKIAQSKLRRQKLTAAQLGALPRVHRDVIEAIEALTAIIGKCPEHIDAKLSPIVLRNVYLNDGRIYEGSLATVTFDGCLINEFTFSDLDFSSAHFANCIVGSLEILDARGTGLELRRSIPLKVGSSIALRGGEAVLMKAEENHQKPGVYINMSDARIDGAKIDMKIGSIGQCYFTDYAPEISGMRFRPSSSVNVFKWQPGCRVEDSPGGKIFIAAEGQQPAISGKDVFSGNRSTDHGARPHSQNAPPDRPNSPTQPASAG